MPVRSHDTTRLGVAGAQHLEAGGEQGGRDGGVRQEVAEGGGPTSSSTATSRAPGCDGGTASRIRLKPANQPRSMTLPELYTPIVVW